MKITNIQGIAFVNTVNNSMSGKRLPVRISFAIKQNYNRILENQIKPYEETKRELRELHKDTAEGNEKLQQELEKLLMEETEMDIKCVELGELEKLDMDHAYDKLSIHEIDAMSFMIAE